VASSETLAAHDPQREMAASTATGGLLSISSPHRHAMVFASIWETSYWV
jgi:hypothetical protein